MNKPNTNSITNIPYFRKYVQKVFPAIYDDSLSYYELLSKVLAHLNAYGETTNKLIDLWNEVNDWLMNDGLKIAVSEKLDALLEDGSLAYDLYTAIERVRQKYYIDVTDMGVKGDGSDETELIQTLIDEYDRLYFPAGTYRVNTLTLKSDLNLKGDFNKSIIRGTGGDSEPVIKINGVQGAYIFNVFFEDIQIHGSVERSLVEINYASNITFLRSKLQADERMVVNGCVIDNASYYVDFIDSHFSYLNVCVIFNGKSNAGLVSNCKTYMINKCVQINHANGIKIDRNTFQDYYICGVALGDDGSGYTSQNTILNNYFEKNYTVDSVVGAIVFESETVRVTSIMGNKYSDLPTIVGTSESPIVLDWSGGSSNEPMQIPNFLQIKPKTKNFTVYKSDRIHGAFQLFSDNDGTDDARVLVKTSTGGYEWEKILKVNDTNTLRWGDYSIVGLKGLHMYDGAKLQIPTGVLDTKGTIGFDLSSNNMVVHNGSKQEYVQHVSTGATENRPTNYPYGGCYFDSTLKKPIWYLGGNVWHDASGSVV